MLAAQAEAAACATTDRFEQAQALADLAQTAAEVGNVNRAEALALGIADPATKAQALADLARKAGPSHARSLLARAVTVGSWISLLDVLGQIEPSVIIAIADEYESLSTRPTPGNTV